MARVHKEALEYMRQVAKDNEGNETRLSEDLEQYIPLLEACKIVRPWTYEEYLVGVQDGDNNGFVFVTNEQAKEILKSGKLRIPMVIPPEEESRRIHDLVTIKDYLRTLQAFDTVSVHDLKATKGEGFVYAKNMTPSEFAAALGDDANFLNLLDLASFRRNAIPPCIDGLPAFDTMMLLRGENLDAGKDSVAKAGPADLSNAAAFQILGQKGTFNLLKTS